MGSYHCKHCGCPEKYYASKEHASRPSCCVSVDKHHKFVYYINYDFYYCSKSLIIELFSNVRNNFNLLNSDSHIDPS